MQPLRDDKHHVAPKKGRVAPVQEPCDDKPVVDKYNLEMKSEQD